jgi:hypothetical protein
MINSKDIAPGTAVYTARRGLEAWQSILFVKVEEHTVVKRTSCGYKVAHRAYTHGKLLMDATYYVSASKEEVAKALMADADERIKQLQAQVEHLMQVKLKLWASYE